jgi:HK97 family phage prohead protease
MTLTTDLIPSEQSDGTVQVGETFTANFKVDIISAEETIDGTLGKVSAIVSAFDVDYVMGWRTKHRMTAETFVDSLADNNVVPLFFQHNWAWSEQPPIGTADGSIATEPKPGLKIDGGFFLDTEGGRSTFRAIKAGALREWSIGYRITKYEVEEADDGFRIVIVKAADFMEASSVLRGANPDTETLKVAGAPAVMNAKLDELIEGMALLVDISNKHERRLAAMETVHDMLVTSLEDAGLVPGAGSGEPAEAAAGGGSDATPEETAPQAEQPPGSPEVVEAGMNSPDRLDRAWERAISRIQTKWDAFVEQAGAGLDGEEPTEDQRHDIEAMTRVVRCLNKTKPLYDAVEHRVTARVLAEQAKAREL